jgi:hypothetical protein
MKMNNKTKKIVYRILRIVWYILGLLILTWNIFWFIKVKILNDYELVRNVILFTLGIFVLIIYLLISLIKWLIKKIRKKK